MDARNFYIYAFNDPVNLLDPNGLDPMGAGGVSGRGEGGSEGTSSGGSDPAARSGSGYTDYNFTAGAGIGITGGVFVDEYGKTHPYLGGGLMTPGICASVSESIAGSVSPGEWSAQASASWLNGPAALALMFTPLPWPLAFAAISLVGCDPSWGVTRAGNVEPAFDLACVEPSIRAVPGVRFEKDERRPDGSHLAIFSQGGLGGGVTIRSTPAGRSVALEVGEVGRGTPRARLAAARSVLVSLEGELRKRCKGMGGTILRETCDPGGACPVP